MGLLGGVRYTVLKMLIILTTLKLLWMVIISQVPQPTFALVWELDSVIMTKCMECAQGDKIHCLDVLHSLTKYTLGFIEDETEDFAKLTEQMDEKFKKQFPTRKELEIVSSTREWKRLDTAARVIQKFYRLYIRSKTHQSFSLVSGLLWVIL